MSLQWQFAAGILYVELFFVLILCLPFISNKIWGKVFKWRIFGFFNSIGNHFFVIVAGMFTMLFLDSVREIKKYEKLADDYESQPGLNLHDPHTNKFRAQRNFYITLYAFVFWFVLRRLITVIAEAARLEATASALMKQAEGASKLAEQMMMDKNDEEDSKNDDDEVKKLKESLKKKDTELAVAKEEVKKLNIDMDVLKKQCKATENEYDRLMKELEKEQHNGDKKDD